LAYYAQRPIRAIAPEELRDRWQSAENPCILAPAEIPLADLNDDPQYSGTLAISSSGWSVACRNRSVLSGSLKN
jgi:hypothetical protein